MNSISPLTPEYYPQFVGRQKAVNMFHSLRTLREQKNVLYVEADGGLGKTWLLQVYIQHCKRQRRPWHTAPEGVDPLIDFFNLENRTVDGLRRSIVDRLGTEHFPNFLRSDKQMQKEMNKSRLAELRRDLDFWFFQEFKRALRAKRTYTALFFDTFEIVHNRRVGRWFLEEFLPHRSTTRLSKKPVCNGLAGDRARIFRLERDGQAEGGLEGLGQRPEGVDLADIVNECE